jgi:hypothetical protein
MNIHRSSSPSRRQRLARHPCADVGGTTRNPNALSLAPHKEPDSLHVHETDFNQVEDDVSTALFLDAPAELGQLLGANPAAYSQGRPVSVDGTNDPEHRD